MNPRERKEEKYETGIRLQTGRVKECAEWERDEKKGIKYLRKERRTTLSWKTFNQNQGGESEVTRKSFFFFSLSLACIADVLTKDKKERM